MSEIVFFSSFIIWQIKLCLNKHLIKNGINCSSIVISNEKEKKKYEIKKNTNRNRSLKTNINNTLNKQIKFDNMNKKLQNN